ncbi:aspartic peptidase domain-containing protein [Kockovaella imperatae]|uniref:Aspartic peptidase domain-containing protein n=1 Tax=Kockovaella imperatae TaxID=4999 RepID=A0A1Y1U8B6_9TREE|nr:aspartic peptidase domain-containing protein [Kockovaella imperatae]ORX34252.1 aspartic peptidase domain-containing protein [Kockovaella imperatae]
MSSIDPSFQRQAIDGLDAGLDQIIIGLDGENDNDSDGVDDDIPSGCSDSDDEQIIQSLEERLWYPPSPTNNVVARPKFNLALEISGGGITPSTTSGGDEPSAANAAAAVATTITASGSNANGFSQLEYAALTDGLITNSTSALVKGGLPYNIEFNDVGYMADVQIGTPPRTFVFLMDSGSADTWVPSTQCGAQCGSHTALGSDVSSTFQASGQQWATQYGSGSVAGVLCSDDMSIAGMKLQNKVFGVSLQESVQFSSKTVPFDGLMGLSFDKLSNQGVITPIEALAQSGLVKSSIMGYALGRVADGNNDGEIVFGQADPNKFDPSTTQTMAVSSSNGFWQVPLGAVIVNGDTVVSGRQVILDTGTSLMVAPEPDADAFHAQIAGSQSLGNGMYSIPCTTEAKVFFQFGNAAFQMDVQDLLFQPTTSDLTGQCVSSLSAGTVTDDQTWLLGDAFLKNVYFTTSVADKTVQLSARTDVPDSSSFGKSNSAAAVQALKENTKTGGAALQRRDIGRSKGWGLMTAGGLAAYFARLF